MRRAARLRRNADFQRVRAAKRSWADPLLVLYAAPNGNLAPRIGISVGKRVGGAVVRNRVRRRVREAVRLRVPELRPGRDLVFIARPASAEADWTRLRAAAEGLLRRAGALPASGQKAVGSGQ